jgi:hypothetical protein
MALNARFPLVAVFTAGLFAGGSADAGDAPSVTARSGEDLARAAAETWAPDARLIYVENDENLGPAGRSQRWGYLFHSSTEDGSRAYSVRGEKILHAADLGFTFDAPPLPAEWIDSESALAAAEAKGGSEFRTEHGAEIRSMFLVRGLFHPDDPDASTWAVVYDSPSAPGLWILVDAETGKVVKKWRG